MSRRPEVIVVVGYAVWLLALYAFFESCGRAEAARFLEPDGGWTQWDTGVQK